MPELTAIQSQVLAGLLAGGSIAAVAREHKIHRSTIYNWRHDHPAFAYALKDARIRQQAAMFDAAQDLAARAYETLGSLLSSDDQQIRLRAAQAILRTVESAKGDTAAILNEPASLTERLATKMGRDHALKSVLPVDRPLLHSTAVPAMYPDQEFDRIRHISTPDFVSRVEQPAAMAAGANR